MLQAIQNIDSNILLCLQDNLRGGVLNAVMVVFTYLGSGGALWLTLAAIFLVTKKYRAVGFSIIFCVAVCWIMSDLVLKNIIQRPRPVFMVEGLTALAVIPASYSFPSGHACSSFAASYVIVRQFGKRGAWAYVVAALISFSRIYVGVHYPSDVIAGALLGALLSIPVYRFRVRFIRFPKSSGQQSP